MLCLVNEPKRIFGTALVARKWRDVLKRKEYDRFKALAIFIIENAEEYRMYCPDIFVEADVLCIHFKNDNKYVKFYITSSSIHYKIGKIDIEEFFVKWDERSRMSKLSEYLYT